MKKIKNFFKEARIELKKVVKPTKKELIKYSFATLVFIVFFALFFNLISFLQALLEKVI